MLAVYSSSINKDYNLCTVRTIDILILSLLLVKATLNAQGNNWYSTSLSIILLLYGIALF